MSQTPTPSQGHQARRTMKAVAIRAFGGLEVLDYTDVPIPAPADGQVLVRVLAAGVGPWDALVRTGRSDLRQPLPLVLGSDLSGVVEAVGPGVSGIEPGQEVYGVTNPLFTGAYAAFAVAEAGMIARKPERLSHPEAASVPVVAVTAWQMLFDHAQVGASQRVLVHGAAGNVGAYAVQLAHEAGADVTATAAPEQAESVRALGAREVIDGRHAEAFAGLERHFDVAIDTVGGSMLTQGLGLLRAGGVLVSSVSLPDQELAKKEGVRAEYLIVAVTTARLDRLTELLEAGTLKTRLGEVLPLSEARAAHEMLAGARERGPGKIVLIPGP